MYEAGFISLLSAGVCLRCPFGDSRSTNPTSCISYLPLLIFFPDLLQERFFFEWRFRSGVRGGQSYLALSEVLRGGLAAMGLSFRFALLPTPGPRGLGFRVSGLGFWGFGVGGSEVWGLGLVSIPRP